ncbi:MAG: hypothetical protein IKS64_02120, partial [Muribaculaceae bacterium]|nr:hypothetical protein [Muribaculaceae bacterium]
YSIIILAALTMCCCTGNSSYRMNAFSNFPENMAPVTVDDSTVNGLIVYYPQFSRIDLVCGKMPDKRDTAVIFCAEAAFTHELLDEFSHSNIDGDHVSGGKRYTGAQCYDNSGAFAWTGDTSWEFVHGEYDDLLDSVAAAGGMGFGQAIIIHDGETIRPLWRDGEHQYRALCEKDGRLCIADSRKEVEYDDFVEMLEQFAPRHALYLDMGIGWNYSWWRDGKGIAFNIHPRAAKSRYCTNWITFYK